MKAAIKALQPTAFGFEEEEDEEEEADKEETEKSGRPREETFFIMAIEFPARSFIVRVG